MKVLFSNLPWWEGEGDTLRRGVRAGSRWPMTLLPQHTYTPFPFHLAYAASYLQEHGFEVVLRDSVARKETYRKWFQAVQHEAPDLVVIETSTPSWESDRKCLEALAYWQVGKAMIVGPPMAHDMARRKALASPGVVSVAIGEYEEAVLKAATTMLDGVEPEPIYNWNLLTEEEMNEAPPPYRNPEEIRLYRDAEYLIPKCGPQLQAWSSRGCPFQCAFCVWPQTMTRNRVRFYQPDRLFAELSEALTSSEREAVYFDDDTFNLRATHVREVCNVMADLNVPWAAMCRIDTLEEKDWTRMANAGCRGVKVGIECASDRVREAMGKKLDLADVRRFLPVLRDLGMNVHGTFLFGYPGEAAWEIHETERLIEECYQLGMTSHQESGAAAHAGTRLWEEGYRASDGARVREEIAA